MLESKEGRALARGVAVAMRLSDRKNEPSVRSTVVFPRVVSIRKRGGGSIFTTRRFRAFLNLFVKILRADGRGYKRRSSPQSSKRNNSTSKEDQKNIEKNMKLILSVLLLLPALSWAGWQVTRSMIIQSTLQKSYILLENSFHDS